LHSQQRTSGELAPRKLIANGAPGGAQAPRELPRSLTHDQLLSELDTLMSRVNELERHQVNVDALLIHKLAAPASQLSLSAGSGSSLAAAGGAGASGKKGARTALDKAKAALARHMAEVAADPRSEGRRRIPKMIHQMYGLFGDKTPPAYLRGSLDSFRRKNPSYTHILWGPLDVQDFVKEYFPSLFPIFERMSLPVLKADLVRYLLVYIFGGIYSDIDTKCLKPIDTWADGHTNVSIIVGIEVDAAGMPDWQKHWGRQLQFSQWTFAATPLHPVLSTTVYKITMTLAARMVEDVQEKEVTSVTGPSVFTDAVYDYMRTFSFDWRDLLGQNQAQLVGDLYVLDITGFSPGVGHMGSDSVYSERAKVQHLFGGSWTDKGKGNGKGLDMDLSDWNSREDWDNKWNA